VQLPRKFKKPLERLLFYGLKRILMTSIYISDLKFVALLSILVFTSISASSQKMTYKGFPSLVWPKLYSITYQKGADTDGEFQKPVFTKEFLSLSGQTVTIPGYLVPFDGGMTAKRFMISSLPLNACFFCGVGGPETVMEVVSNREVTYTDKPVQISGVLRLNDKDPDKMIYTLEAAEFLGEIEF
jgi:hypothetical protein